MQRRMVLGGVAALLLAGQVLAEESNVAIAPTDENLLQNLQVIVITATGFFPQITYVHEGETVLFYNQAEASRTVAAVMNEGDSAPEWTTVSFAHGEGIEFIVTPGIELNFATIEGSDILGAFSFDAPPT